MRYAVPIRDRSGKCFDGGFAEISASSYKFLISSLKDKGHFIREEVQESLHFITRIVYCDEVPVCYIDKHKKESK